MQQLESSSTNVHIFAESVLRVVLFIVLFQMINEKTLGSKDFTKNLKDIFI